MVAFVIERECSMARSPNENVIKAQEMYKQGMKLIDIANALGVPDGTVRRWKSIYKWDESESERSDKKANKKCKRSEKRRKQNIESKEVVVKEVKEVLSNTELTDKQRLFCLYYSKTFNATRSYQKAYGCAYDSAMVNGPRLLGNDRVKVEIMRLKEERYARAFLSEEDIVQKYMDIAFADVTDFVTFHTEDMTVEDDLEGLKKIKVSVVNVRDSNEVDGTIISEVSKGKDGVKVKLADRMKALQWLADHMDLATEEQRARIAALKAKAGEDGNEETIKIVDDV